MRFQRFAETRASTSYARKIFEIPFRGCCVRLGRFVIGDSITILNIINNNNKWNIQKLTPSTRIFSFFSPLISLNITQYQKTDT